MPVLYVVEPGAVLRKSGGSLLVTLDADADDDPDTKGDARRTLLEVEPHRLESVALVGRTHATREALELCLRERIAVVFLDRSSRVLATLVPPRARLADLALLQLRTHGDPQTRLRWARAVVSAKLTSGAEVLEDVQSNLPGNAVLGGAIADVRAAVRASAGADDMETLLGIEGAGARRYFEGYAEGFRGPVRFAGRARRPPPDPANALLSFAYVLLAGRIESTLVVRGLDPMIGFFHELRPGRPSLALDLLEEVRHAVVDRFVLRTLNLGSLGPQDFEPDSEHAGGVRLKRPALREFLRLWEKHLLRPVRDREDGGALEMRDALRRQADRLARALRGEEPYRPFVYGD